MPNTIIAGLGNPGNCYQSTRHNLGFRVIDIFARKITSNQWEKDSRSKAIITKTDFCGKSLILAKPMAFMNHSGEVIAALCRYYQISAENLIVLYDDVNLECGRVKVATDEHAGGHNGIKSIFFHLKATFTRYRLGVGPKTPPHIPLEDFVLASFSKNENEILEKKMNEILAGLELIIKDGSIIAMNAINRRPKNHEFQTDNN